MAAILPLLFVVLLAMGLRAGGGRSRRECLLLAAVAAGAVVGASSELLGALGRLGRGPVLGLWIAAACGAGGFALWRWRRRGGASHQAGPPVEARPHWTIVAMLLAVALLVAAIAIPAVVSPPNTWDSMTYHLARVEHWMQNRTLAHYPTHIQRQLYLAPFAECAILHLRLLSGGGDRLANLVQLAAMLGGLCGVSLIARGLGAGASGQALAIAVCAAIPMGVLQASSTQTDYVTAFWLVCFAVFGLQVLKTPGRAAAFVPTHAALALAVMTKATAVVLGAPLLVWFAVATARRLGRQSWRPGVSLAVILVAFNAPHALRNIETFGNTRGPDAGRNYLNETMSPAMLASNLSRNLALHAGTPWRPMNEATDAAVARLHAGLDLEVQDPRISYPYGHWRRPGVSLHEDHAANPLHLLLGLAALAGLPFARNIRRGRAGLYVLALAAGFVLFCGVLRWQIWHARLHLPLLVLGSAAVGAVLGQIRPRWAAAAIGVAAVALAMPYALANETRPLVGEGSILARPREQLYFTSKPETSPAAIWMAAADAIAARDPGHVGLVLDGNDGEYLLWALLRRRMGKLPVIEHARTDWQQRPRERAARGLGRPPLVVIVHDNGRRIELVESTAASRPGQ